MKRIIVYVAMLSALLTLACGSKPDQKRICVVDRASVLTAEQKFHLTDKILELDSSIGSQVCVLTILSLNGENIDEFGFRTATAWGLGRKDFDDGVLITVAMYDRMMRIDVGIGLERIITDEIAADIISKDMAPLFREEKYFEGFDLAIGRIVGLIKENKSRVGQR